MFRSIAIAALITAAPLFVVSPAGSQPADTMTTLKFSPAQSSQDIRGTVSGYQGAVYAVNARAGDRINVKLDGPRNLSLYYNVVDPSGETIFNGSISGATFNGTVRKGGVHQIRVYLMRNDARRGKRADFKLSIRLDSSLPIVGPGPRPPNGAGPSFDCRRASGVVETTICRNASLSDLDARLTFVYKDALAGASSSRAVMIRRDQQTWLIERNQCARRGDVSLCLDKAYRARIAVLEPKR